MHLHTIQQIPQNSSILVFHIVLRRVDWVEERYDIQQNNKNRWVTLRLTQPTLSSSGA